MNRRAQDPEEFDATTAGKEGASLRDKNSAESFELRLGTRRVRITGGVTLVIALLAVALGWVIWSEHQARVLQTLVINGALKSISQDHSVLIKELGEQRSETSYILTLPQAERDRLRDRLRVPERFR